MTTMTETKVQSEATLRAGMQTKALKWNPVHVGDCEQDNGQLVFHSDGTGTWSCTVLTYQTHTHDVWHSSFDIKGLNGATLFSLGTFDGPPMSDGNPPPRYSWTHAFAFPPDFFNAITSAVQHSRC